MLCRNLPISESDITGDTKRGTIFKSDHASMTLRGRSRINFVGDLPSQTVEELSEKDERLHNAVKRKDQQISIRIDFDDEADYIAVDIGNYGQLRNPRISGQVLASDVASATKAVSEFWLSMPGYQRPGKLRRKEEDILSQLGTKYHHADEHFQSENRFQSRSHLRLVIQILEQEFRKRASRHHAHPQSKSHQI